MTVINRELRFPLFNLILISFLSLWFLFSFPTPSDANSTKDRHQFQQSIVDYRKKLNPKYKKIKRRKTKYIIIHTTELGLNATLKVVTKGKRFRNGRKTNGGHIHYVIARNGRTYRTLDKRFRADHAGLSMWNKATDISQVSIGIEMVGYHYAAITESQYRSVGILIEILQGIYGLDDRAILTHSQVAYGRPNRWFKRNHRGRKRCAKNFIRSKARIYTGWNYDPDVRSGRLLPDPQLSDVFYGRHTYTRSREDDNIITKKNTAWSIAGGDFNSRSTIYKLPTGKVFSGDQIAGKIGWNRLPQKTVVLLKQETEISSKTIRGPIKTITDTLTAWSFAGKAYNKKSTIYFMPSGQIRPGSAISDWDDLSVNTRIIIGYKGPFHLNKKRTAYQITGKKHNDPKTIYYLPGQRLLTGDQIRDFNQLPRGTLIFLPKK